MHNIQKTDFPQIQHQLQTWKQMMLVWFLYLSLQHGACTQEARCTVSASGNCIQQVTGEIKGKFFEEKRPFTIFYNPPEQKREIAAFFSFIGLYHCQAAKGFNCDDENIKNTFSITVNPDVPCKAGTFTFSAEGEEPIICIQTQTVKSEPAEIDQSKTNENNRCEDDQTKIIIVTIFATIVSVGVIEAAVFGFVLRRGRKRKLRSRKKTQQQLFETDEDELSLLEYPIKDMSGDKIDSCL